MSVTCTPGSDGCIRRIGFMLVAADPMDLRATFARLDCRIPEYADEDCIDVTASDGRMRLTTYRYLSSALPEHILCRLSGRAVPYFEVDDIAEVRRTLPYDVPVLAEIELAHRRRELYVDMDGCVHVFAQLPPPEAAEIRR